MMRFLLTFTFVLQASSVFADETSDAIARTYSESRAQASYYIGSFLRGDCDKILRPTHCDSCLKNAQVNVEAREDEFFIRAARDQVKALNCEVKQLRSIYNGFSSGFIRLVLTDIYRKLPDLRRKYDAIQVQERRITASQASLRGYSHNNHVGIVSEAKRNEAHEILIDAQVKKAPLVDALHTLLASIWRFDDPHMSDFIFRMIHSDRSPEDIIGEALQRTSNYTLFGINMPGGLNIGTAPFNFQENVIRRMLEDALGEGSSLSSAYEGNTFDVNNLYTSGRKLLFARSDWATHLNESASSGNTENAYLMCVMDHKYGRGDAAMSFTVDAAAFVGTAVATRGGSLVSGVRIFSGGGGAVLKGARFNNLVRAKTLREVSVGFGQNVLRAAEISKVAAVAAGSVSSAALKVGARVATRVAAGGAISAAAFKNVGICLQSQSSISYSGSCSTMSSIEKMERQRLETENCMLNMLITAGTFSPTLVRFLRGFRPGSSGVQSVAADAAVVRKITQRQKIDEHYSDIDDNMIVVTGTRRTRASDTARMEEPPKVNYELKRRAHANDQELREKLSSLNKNTDELIEELDNLGVDQFLTKYSDDLSRAEVRRVRSLAGRRKVDRENLNTFNAAEAKRLEFADDMKVKFDLPDDAHELLRRRLNSKNYYHLHKIEEKVPGSLRNKEKLELIIDKLTGISTYSNRQKSKVVRSIVKDMKDWSVAREMPKTLADVKRLGSLPRLTKDRIAMHFRNKLFDRRVLKNYETLRAKNPNLSRADLMQEARLAANIRRRNSLRMQRACTDTSITQNHISKKAGALFGKANVAASIGFTGISYALVTWNNEVSKTEWGTRLGYEVIMSYYIGKWGSAILKNQNSGVISKSTSSYTVYAGISAVEATIHSLFFSGSQRKAKRHLDNLRESENFEQDMLTMIDYFENRSSIEKTVDEVGDIATNLIAIMHPKEGVTHDLNLEELKGLSRDELEDPIVQERIMNILEDKIYSEEMEGDTNGSVLVDRLMFNLEYNAHPIKGVLRSVLVGVATYQAVCRSIHKPYLAVAGIVGYRAISTGYYTWNKMQETGR